MKARKAAVKSAWVFPGDSPEAAILGTSIDHQHDGVRDTLKLSNEFVVHSLRHTMLTRLGEAGADAFTIMRIAGHSSITMTMRYVHPQRDAIALAFAETQYPRVPAIQDGDHARLVTKEVTVDLGDTGEGLQVIGGTRTPTV